MSEHTPTPWTVCDLGPCDGLQIEGADGTCVIEDVGNVSDVDAAFIVRAVNHYDDLLEACQSLVVLVDNDPPSPTAYGLWDVFRSARAAITKATGKVQQ